MSKKAKKSTSEALMNSILEDLQRDNVEVSYSSQRELKELQDALIWNGDSSSQISDEALVSSDNTRALPAGLDSETAIFGYSSKKKKNQDSASRTDVQVPAKVGLPAPAPLSSPVQELKTEMINSVTTDLPPIPSLDGEGNVASEFSSTRKLQEDGPSMTFRTDHSDRTVPMNRDTFTTPPEAGMKVSYGVSRPLTKFSASLAASASEAQLMQAENLRMAQTRILDLEKEVEHLRQENELLASAGDIAKKRAEELMQKAYEIERIKIDALDQAKMEMNIYRENMVDKEREMSRLRNKIEELQTRLAKDLKKIRVRERELENRLELSKMEKTALMRAKDESILDLKGKLDQLNSELETYKQRSLDLNQKVDGQHEQLSRTVRALRLALTHLEANDMAGMMTPYKKAD